jgi:hypothetical protein
MSAQVHPAGSKPLPTGMELMSGPITSGGLTRQQKEIEFVFNNIETRIQSLAADEGFQTYKALLFSTCVFSAMIGVTLILYGFHTTFFFERYDGNIPAIVFGAMFCCPIFYWVYYLFLPDKEQKRQRRKLAAERIDRRKPTLFNQLVEEARLATEPPPRKVRILAHIRKHDYPVLATTMEELNDFITGQCGLAVERQLLRYNDVDLEIIPHEKLDVYYGLDDNARVYVYNKGGFFTNNSPLKKVRVDYMKMNEEFSVSNMDDMDSLGSASRKSFNQGGSRQSLSNKTSMSGGLKSALSTSMKSEKKEGRPAGANSVSW